MASRLFAITLLLLAVFAIPVHATELTLVTGDQYAPFTDQRLPHGGMISEMVKVIFHKMGYAVHIDFKPWKRGYMEARESLYLGTFPYAKTDERLQEFLYSEPLHVVHEVFYVRRDATIRYAQDEDLTGLTVCRPLGYLLRDIQPLLDAKIITVQQPSQLENCFRMLELKRVDLVLINETVGKEVVSSIYGASGHNAFKILEKPLTELSLHFIISKQNPAGALYIQAFNKALEELKRDGTLDAIISKHLKNSLQHEIGWQE
jgi:polar amino acid transport system substrate-binding protein